MKVYIIITFVLFKLSSFAQLYSFQDGRRFYFVELFKDSARLEIFQSFGTHEIFSSKKVDAILNLRTNSPDTIFSGQQNHIIKRKGFYFLLYKNSDSKKSNKVKLEKCKKDDRELFRKQSYHYDINKKLFRAQDSLSGPTQRIKAHTHTSFTSINSNTLLSFDEYKISMDHMADSIRNMIVLYKKPIVDHYYTKANSLKQLDSTEVFDLLSKANYFFSYGAYFLYAVAIERPEFLIHYIDQGPRNKDTVLRAIKFHRNYKQITNKVKETSLQTKGKEEIVKQGTKRKRQDLLGGALFVTAVLTEIGLVILIVILLSK